MRFYLGTHLITWLRRPDAPALFVSHRALSTRKRKLPRATNRWALDSGGYTELTLHGTWATTTAAYIAACRRYHTEIGQLDWCAPQDWICDPTALAATQLTIPDHQRRTVDNLLHGGRYKTPCPHKPDTTNCANCFDHAMEWRTMVLDCQPAAVQPALFGT